MAEETLEKYIELSGRNINQIARITGMDHQRLYQYDRQKTKVKFDARSGKIDKIWGEKVYYIAPDAEGVNNG